MNKKKVNYDACMEDIQAILIRIQDGNLGLEAMRDEVAKAMELISTCRNRLREIKGEMDQLVSEEEA